MFDYSGPATRRAALIGLSLVLLSVRLGQAQEPTAAHADINGDGEVNFFDVLAVRRCLGQDPQARPFTACNQADTNQDGRVDATDLAIVTSQLGRRDYPFGLDIDPATLVEDPRGSTYPINRAVLHMAEHVTRAEVEALAAAHHGRLVGAVPSINLYTLEVPTTTMAELDALLALLEQDPRVISAVQAWLMNYYASLPTDLTRLRRTRPALTRAYDLTPLHI